MMILHWKTLHQKARMGCCSEPERNFSFKGPRNTGITPEEIGGAEEFLRNVNISIHEKLSVLNECDKLFSTDLEEMLP
ncbi:hypothetical protein Trydic_g12337 [Trypoxylus dichotomus]